MPPQRADLCWKVPQACKQAAALIYRQVPKTAEILSYRRLLNMRIIWDGRMKWLLLYGGIGGALILLIRMNSTARTQEREVVK